MGEAKSIGSLTKEQVWEKYQEAMEGMYNESNKPWTLEYCGCEVVVGNTDDAHGREVQIKISVTSNQDEWE